MRHSFFIVIFQGLAAGMQLYILRLLNTLIPAESLGFWLTLITISSWLHVSDFGIANSFRNKLTELFAKQDFKNLNKYINSAYKYTLIFFTIILLLGVGISIAFAKYELYYIDSISYIDSTVVILLLLLGSVVNLYFLLNSSIAYALMNPVFKPLVLFIFQFIFCLLLILWSYEQFSYQGNPLVMVSILFCISSIFSSTLATIYLFIKNQRLLPKISEAKYSDFKELFSTAKSFFLIQITAIVLFSTDTVIIANLFEYSEVVTYKVSTRVFFLFIMIQGAILSPYWAKYTIYIAKKDSPSIFLNLKKTLLMTFLLFILIFIVSQIGADIVDLWMGGLEHYNKTVFVSMAILIALMNWSSNFSTLYNGIGELRIQSYISVAAIFINIPLSIVLVRWFGFGSEGVIYGTIASLSLFAIVAPLYVKRLVFRRCVDEK